MPPESAKVADPPIDPGIAGVDSRPMPSSSWPDFNVHPIDWRWRVTVVGSSGGTHVELCGSQYDAFRLAEGHFRVNARKVTIEPIRKGDQPDVVSGDMGAAGSGGEVGQKED